MKLFFRHRFFGVAIIYSFLKLKMPKRPVYLSFTYFSYNRLVTPRCTDDSTGSS
jgi:hypothetical protein